jgi:hypothetical protein
MHVGALCCVGMLIPVQLRFVCSALTICKTGRRACGSALALPAAATGYAPCKFHANTSVNCT